MLEYAFVHNSIRANSLSSDLSFMDAIPEPLVSVIA
jgi:hypothetical protein